ncbi:MAG: adenylate/guanylate cyclase domain-containing protein [Nonlabens sp.]
MKHSVKQFYRILRSYLIGWLLAVLLWNMLSFMGGIKMSFVDISLVSRTSIGVVAWLFQGTLFGLLQWIIEFKLKKRKSFLVSQVISIALQILMSFFVIICVYLFATQTGYIERSLTLEEFINGIQGFWVIIVYALLVNFAINFIRYLDLVVGRGNLLKMMKGVFYIPKEQHKIFMFLDLKGSTTIAEKLGHIKYSSFIQDCFHDLAIVEDYDAQIYQYVGDEAVLVWDLQNGVKGANCIQAFFEFNNLMKRRKRYYQKKYKIQPEFKAGIHSGVVVATEVGLIKKELAYHGDTINITARLEEECNKQKQSLIVSKDVVDQLDSSSNYDCDYLGEVSLRGKRNVVEIYCVNLKKAS